MLSCKQAVEFMSMERDGMLAERLALAFHLTTCRGCRNYRKQLAFMHVVCQHYRGSATASKKITDERNE